MLSSSDYELAKSVHRSWLTSEIHAQERDFNSAFFNFDID